MAKSTPADEERAERSDRRQVSLCAFSSNGGYYLGVALAAGQ
jgi:hypothetical protein